MDLLHQLGQTLKQSQLTTHLAIKYFDRLLSELVRQTRDFACCNAEFSESQL